MQSYIVVLDNEHARVIALPYDDVDDVEEVLTEHYGFDLGCIEWSVMKKPTFEVWTGEDE
jgi:hypothetical protein